jgi:hypothetical protein
MRLRNFAMNLPGIQWFLLLISKNQYAEKGKRGISLVVEAESSRKITLSRALDYLGIKTWHYDQIVDMLYEYKGE